MKIFCLKILIAIIITCSTLYSHAQIFNQNSPPPSNSGPFSQSAPPPPIIVTDTPLDGGVVFLIIIGVALTVRRLRKKQSLLAA